MQPRVCLNVQGHDKACRRPGQNLPHAQLHRVAVQQENYARGLLSEACVARKLWT